MLQPCKLSKISPVKGTDTASKDFISKLPDEILCSIISNLTLRDSVRTSVLSHRWNRVSSSLPDLMFDWFNMFLTGDDFQGAHQHPCLSNQEKFVSVVNQYLKFHTGTSLHSFKVSFCLSHGFAFDIDRWVSFAIRMGVEHLFIELYCKTCDKPSRQSLAQETEKNYILRSNLFEDEKSKLKHLLLVGCRIGTNFTTQFSFLETLTFTHCPLALYDLHNMFPYLVKLKYLVFYFCTLPVKLSPGSLLLLQSFSVKFCDGIKEIEFSNANLLFLECFSYPMITLNLNGVPNLKKLTHFVDHGIPHIFNHAPSQLPMLEDLKVYISSHSGKNVPDNITAFSNVTRLELILMRQSKFDILAMISLLKAFPRMRGLILWTLCAEDDEQRKPQPSEYVHKCLEYAVIGGFYGSEIEFAEYLLTHTLSLKQLAIQQEMEQSFKKRQSWNEGERQMVYKQLQQLSKDVKLIIK